MYEPVWRRIGIALIQLSGAAGPRQRWGRWGLVAKGRLCQASLHTLPMADRTADTCADRP